jgi:hypothetical protein
VLRLAYDLLASLRAAVLVARWWRVGSGVLLRVAKVVLEGLEGVVVFNRVVNIVDTDGLFGNGDVDCGDVLFE